MGYRCRWKYLGRNYPNAKPVTEEDVKIFSLLTLKPYGRIFNVILKDSGKKIGRVMTTAQFSHHYCHFKKHWETSESFYTNDIPEGEPEGMRASIKLYKEFKEKESK